MLLIIGALINMKIKVFNIVIHNATVDRYVSASRKCFSIADKTLMCRGQVFWLFIKKGSRVIKIIFIHFKKIL